MNQSDTSHTGDTLTTIVGDALLLDAQRAPAPPDTWSATGGLVPVAPFHPRRPRPRRLVGAVGLSAAAAVVAGIMIVGLSPLSTTDRRPATEASEWLPTGSEFLSTDLGPATSVPMGPAVEDLTRRIGIDGHPDQIITRSVRYGNGATAEEHFCFWENGSGGCRPATSTGSWSIGISSSIDNGFADTDLWVLEGLPDTVAYVTYTTAVQQLWQRPVFGFVAFPFTDPDPVVIGYDRNGTEVGRYSDDISSELDRAYVPPLQADLTEAEQLDVWDLTNQTMTSCLTDAGGQLGPGGVATFADHVDQVAVWDGCVAAVKATVAARVADLESLD